ncbi:MAG TPA: M12 family metallo-peptidase [Allosphingosinicella sp.]|uniref:M12 family metallo-peptidase n=1 Tax=Allosphingosinicella sp. TaxID=2823234 RepID=UPI002EDB7A0D
MTATSWGKAALAILLSAAASCGTSEGGPAPLISSREAGLAPGAGEQVSLNGELIEQLTRLRVDDPDYPERIPLNMFEDKSFVGIVETVSERTPETRVVKGSLEGIAEGRFTMVVHKGLVALYLIGDDGMYLLHPVPEGHVVKRGGAEPDLIEEAIADEAGEAAEGEAGFVQPNSEDGSRVDVAILYTPSAAREWGDAAKVETSAYLNEEFSNDALAASGTSIRITAIRQVPDQTPARLGSAMASETVRAERGAATADLVLLFHHRYNSAHGVAYCYKPRLRFEYNRDGRYLGLVSADSLQIYMTPSHELGHLFGAGHTDLGSCMSRGYSFRSGGSRWGDMMDYDGADNRLPLFSNPQLRFRGVPVGTERANNAEAIRQSRAAIANYVEAP